MKTKECLGRCPKCGSNRVEYGNHDFMLDGNLKWDLVCEKCGCEAVEYYNVKYVETEYEREVE